eukprot:TRINITY_DN3276_c0_g1_i2.p1 TRINITY_DN3276_c0_g1~~TRINITY_DN3276_c0_g1_i2.p1  ORF type:complete len:789 (+),score=165.62 TRINITY_DN3276_c0_g1_i2:56-2422(+)
MSAPTGDTSGEWKTDYSHLFNNPQDSDVTFMVEGIVFYAHKHIICSRCPYFRSLLEKLVQFSDMEVQIDIRDASAELFAILLRYIYTNMVIFPPAQSWNLYALAQNYRLQDLQIRVQLYMASTLNTENLYHIWSHAQLMGARFLSKICADYFEKNVATNPTNQSLSTLGTTLFLNHMSIENGVGISIQPSMLAQNIRPSSLASNIQNHQQSQSMPAHQPISSQSSQIPPQQQTTLGSSQQPHQSGDGTKEQQRRAQGLAVNTQNITPALFLQAGQPPPQTITHADTSYVYLPNPYDPMHSSADSGKIGRKSSDGVPFSTDYSSSAPLDISLGYAQDFGDGVADQGLEFLNFSAGGGDDYLAQAQPTIPQGNRPLPITPGQFRQDLAQLYNTTQFAASPFSAPSPLPSNSAPQTNLSYLSGPSLSNQDPHADDPMNPKTPNFIEPPGNDLPRPSTALLDAQTSGLVPSETVVSPTNSSVHPKKDPLTPQFGFPQSIPSTTLSISSTHGPFSSASSTSDPANAPNTGLKSATVSREVPKAMGLKDEQTEPTMTSIRKDFSAPAPVPFGFALGNAQRAPVQPASQVSTQSQVLSESLESILMMLKGMIPLIQIVVGADRCSIYVHDSTRSELCTLYSAGSDVMHLRIPDSTGIAGSVFGSGQSVNIPDAYSDPRFYSSVDQNTGYKTKSVLCSPIKIANGTKIAGVVQVLNKRGGGAFSREDERQLESFVNVATMLLDKVHDDVSVIKDISRKARGLARVEESDDDDTSTLQNRSISEADENQSVSNLSLN